MPTDMPSSLLFNVDEGEGKYVIHAGDGYNGMSYRKQDKEVLIHELTHVWQGEHSSSSWDYVFGSMWSQALADDAYTYKGTRWKHWDDYNPEQQAQIVEDWFADGMNESEDPNNRDMRFYYVKKYIRGEKVDYDWTLPNIMRTSESLKGTLPADAIARDYDSYLLPILAQRFSANDVSGYGARVRKLEEFFTNLGHVDARWLLQRLEMRRLGDKVAQYFHEHLSTTTRNRLAKILRER